MYLTYNVSTELIYAILIAIVTHTVRKCKTLYFYAKWKFNISLPSISCSYFDNHTL